MDFGFHFRLVRVAEEKGTKNQHAHTQITGLHLFLYTEYEWHTLHAHNTAYHAATQPLQDIERETYA